MKLVSLFLASLLLSVGGAGAATAVNNYIRAHVETTHLATVEDVAVAPPTPTATPMPTAAVTPKGKATVHIGAEIDDE